MIAKAQTVESTLRRPLRLWPGVVIVILQWVTRFAIPLIAPDVASFAVLSGPIGGLAVIVWWAFFSRAPWSELWRSTPVRPLLSSCEFHS